jgi:hypothetical protein
LGAGWVELSLEATGRKQLVESMGYPPLTRRL